MKPKSPYKPASKNSGNYKPSSVASENKAGGGEAFPEADYGRGRGAAYGDGEPGRGKRTKPMLTCSDDMEHLKAEFGKKGAGH